VIGEVSGESAIDIEPVDEYEYECKGEGGWKW
jgi:hypothetical protein